MISRTNGALSEIERTAFTVATSRSGDVGIEVVKSVVLNVLEDLRRGQIDFKVAQRTLVAILEEAATEKRILQETQSALLNLQEDLVEQQNELKAVQRAVLNILEDFDHEKKKVEALNRELRTEIEERRRAQEEIRKLNRELQERVVQQGADLAISNRELQAFSYSASHDLRAPLRAIDGFCQAILEDYGDSLDADGKHLLQRVRAASQHMDRLIDGVLELSRTVRSQLHRATVDISGMTQSIALELQKSNPGRRVEFEIAPAMAVNADPNLIRTVLEKLLGNAWKFTSSHPQARIEVGMIRSKGETAYFVRDDGAGFDMKYVEKLFGPFQRLHSPSEFEGTGIGLAIAQRIIERHGGRIWAEGRVERGATFFMTVPDAPKEAT